MSNAAVKVNDKVVGVFTKEEAEKFLTPLSDFQKICNVKLSLRFSKEKNQVSFRGTNEGKNVICYIDYLPESFPNLKVSDDTQAHIFELDEVVSLSKIFSNGFNFAINDSDKSLDLASGDDDNNQSFRYYLSDATVIPPCPVSLKLDSTVWHANFTWDTKKYAAFVKGMSTLRHKYIIFEGKKGESTVTVSVTENTLKTTTLKTVIKLANANADNYKVLLDKENFLNPVTSSIGVFDISVSTRVTRMVGTSTSHKAVYYVTSAVDTNK